MHRDDGLGARCYRGRYSHRVDVERIGLDVNENRSRAAVADGVGRRDEGEGRRDHLIAGTDVQRGQGQTQRIGARCDADTMRAVAKRRDFPLQRSDIGTKHELAALQHSIDGLSDLVAQGVVLDFQVQDWDHEG